jgi:hypothetical protein
MLAFQPLTVTTKDPSLERPFAALFASLALIVGTGAGFVLLAPSIAVVMRDASTSLRNHTALFAVVAAIVVAVNLFEAGVHVLNAAGLWFNHALLRSPRMLRLSQHVEHLEARPSKPEYLALNLLDACGFAAAFVVSGQFNAFWAIVFGPHLATMVLAAWELDVFLKLFLLDIRRYLPKSATATVSRRALLRGHLFMRGAFVLTDAVARSYLCGVIVFG